VHAISGVMDFFDYEPDASGMTYRNSLNTGGVAIDGTPDSGVTAGLPDWELVTGDHGSLIMVGRMDTDASITLTSFYEDDDTSPTTQCTGDADAYGSSGLWVTSAIPNTDPTLTPPVYYLTGRRTIYYEAPGASVADAELRADFANNPLETTVVDFGVVPAVPPWALALLAASILASRSLGARPRSAKTGPSA
jgi:hypothetical protein